MTGARRLSLAFAAVLTVLALLATGVSAGATGRGSQKKIAFWDYMSGQIYTVNTDGSGLRQLTHTKKGVQAMFPDFSPNGRLMVFSVGNPAHPWRIWVMHSDGSHQHRVAGDTRGFRDNTPSYTPDGRALVFSRCQPGDGVCAIWKMRADGTHKHALTRYVSGGLHERVDFDPAVSPNGKWIAFLRFESNGIQAQIWLMNADGTRPHAITPARLEATGPSWSPDSRWIVFNTNNNRTGSRVFAMRPNGTGLKALTPSRFPHNDAGPSYSPDGKHIAFSSDRRYGDGCCFDLFEMRADGSGEHKLNLALHHAGIIGPVWQP